MRMSQGPTLTALIGATLAGAGCADPEAERGVGERTDSGDIQTVFSPRPAEPGAWSIAPEPTVTIGVRAGEEPYQLFRVRSARRLPDGRVMIGNAGSHEVRIFSPRGEFLASFGRQGEGPGEFGQFSTMRLYPTDDSVVVTDESNDRVHFFALDGTFGRTFAVRFNGYGNTGLIDRLESGEFLASAVVGSGALRGAHGDIIQGERAYLLVSETGDASPPLAVARSQPRIVNTVAGTTHYPFVPLTPDPSAAVGAGHFYLATGERGEIREYDLGGGLRRMFRWAAPRLSTAAIWDRYKEEVLQELREIGDDGQLRLYRGLYQQDLPLPDSAPAVEAILVDAAGNLWARRFRPFWIDGETDWDVIAPDGRWLTTVHVPQGVAVLQVGADFIVGRRTDELGVEQVVIHELRRARGSAGTARAPSGAR
ncbi:MAG: 6-bladed beta-propeller [Longimicrobiales bacterium]